MHESSYRKRDRCSLEDVDCESGSAKPTGGAEGGVPKENNQASFHHQTKVRFSCQKCFRRFEKSRAPPRVRACARALLPFTRAAGWHLHLKKPGKLQLIKAQSGIIEESLLISGERREELSVQGDNQKDPAFNSASKITRNAPIKNNTVKTINNTCGSDEQSAPVQNLPGLRMWAERGK